jgi:hypothetical protein
MSEYLLIGPVLLEAFELPSRVGWGGRQRLAVHRLPGGRRVIDAMGRDDADIGWTGVFTGGDAVARARAVDLMRAGGLVWPLSWGSFFYSVAVARFEAVYERDNWVPYRIACTVLRDEAEGLLEDGLSLDEGVLADLGAVAALPGIGAIAALAAAPGGLRAGGRWRRWMAGGLRSIARLPPAGRRCARPIPQARPGCGRPATRPARWPNSPPRGGRWRAPMPAPRRWPAEPWGKKMRTILQAGGTLFHVAAAELGDATQWLRIARLNNLSDPMLSGVVELRLPARDASAGGGIAEQ